MSGLPHDDNAFPPHGRLAGIDYGTVRIGIAVCDAERRLASPWDTYQRQPADRELKFFQQLAAAEQLVGWVVGLPMHTDGQESQKSLETRAFAKWLREATALPVQFFDERYTSLQAGRLLMESGMSRQKRKQRLDRVAAQLILAGFLESPHAAGSADSL